MFNLNINWLKIIKENIPSKYHTSEIFDWLKILICPINKIYQEFLQAYDVFVYKIRFNGQIIYLEKILNDKFSPVSGGIYIVDGSSVTPYYIYNKSESRTPIYLYKTWKSSQNYSIGQFSLENNKVYKALTNNLNKQPSVNPSDWAYYKEVTYVRTKTEFDIQYNFIIKIPSTITFNIIAIRAIVDYYRLPGKRYKIELY